MIKHLFQICLVLSIIGCAATPNGPSGGSSRTGTNQPGNIETLLMDAERAGGKKASRLRILAARAALDNGNIEQSKQILALVTEPFVDEDSTRIYLLTSTRIAILERSPLEAFEYLNDNHLQAVPLTEDLQIEIGQLRSEAYLLGRSYVASARERIYIDSLLTPDEKAQNHELIFSALLAVPANSLSKQAENAITSDLRGWLSLAALTRQYQDDPLRQLQQLNNWKKLWSNHPASTQLPAGLQMLSRVVKEQPSAIALLLPLQGTLGPFGRAIRDGILAAHYDQSNGTALRIYDTTNSDISSTVDRAVSEGAELIIGPLSRENVSALATLDLAVPVVALNRTIGATGNPDLYQFGLAPEDEMIQVAEQVNKEGYIKALTIAPEGEWGDRNVAVFRAHWESLGGILVEEARFSDQRDYSDLVKSLLKVDQSELRSKELRRITGQRFEFTPRRRQDIDFIFLLANPAQARGINPTLAFFYADDIPVYATSHVHEYSDSRIDNIDLNGIRFCDIPWKLASTGGLQSEVQDLWETSRSTYSPYFALGIDAYRLYPRLQQLKEIPGERLFGATGVLTLKNNTIVRSLMWAQFKNGNVVSIPLVLENI
jgi:hypothetical protein